MTLVLLGALKLIGQQFAWLAFVVAGLAELVALLQPADRENQDTPSLLTAENVRTQDRGYDRALRRLRAGGTVRYEDIEIKLLGDSVVCQTRPEQPLKQDEHVARGELERARNRWESLCRAAPDLDALGRGKEMRLVLLDPKSSRHRILAAFEEGTFRWAGREPERKKEGGREPTRPS